MPVELSEQHVVLGFGELSRPRKVRNARLAQQRQPVVVLLWDDATSNLHTPSLLVDRRRVFRESCTSVLVTFLTLRN